MNLQWSPAEIGRQRLVVGRIARRTELDRQRLDVARRDSVAALRRALGGPLGLALCFAAGCVLGAARRPRARAPGEERKSSRLRAALTTLLWLVRAHVKRVAQESPPPASPPEPLREQPAP